MHTATTNRFDRQAGIAIGPILFVVALLAILATAISAGSSTFATSSGQETNRTNASSMIQIGQSLKLGMARLIALGTAPASVDVNTQNTTATNALFSPVGGGLVAPSSALSNSGSDAWIITWGNVTGLGSGTSPERLALLKVTSGVCDQINTQLANGATPAGMDVGAFTNAVNLTNWPAGLTGKQTGCLNSSTGTIGTFFYQVMSIQ